MPKKIAKVSPLAMAIVVIDTGRTYIHCDNDRCLELPTCYCFWWARSARSYPMKFPLIRVIRSDVDRKGASSCCLSGMASGPVSN